jgi:hypothetical protein
MASRLDTPPSDALVHGLFAIDAAFLQPVEQELNAIVVLPEELWRRDARSRVQPFGKKTTATVALFWWGCDT